MTKKKLLKTIKDTIFIILGTFLMGFAFNVFLNANKISPSGFAGLSSILSNVLYMKLNILIPASVIYLLANVILFIFAFRTMGLRFAINSAIGVVAYSIFMEVCNFDIGLATKDLLLCAIYGGVIMGIGLGLVFKGHGSTGGSDMLANLLRKKFNFITVGNFVLIVDFCVIVLSFIAYQNLTLALYSLIAIFVTSKFTDVLVSGVQTVKAYYIISKQADEIADHIIKNMHRGVTEFYSKGAFSGNDQKVLMTVITKSEIARLKSLVAEIDKTAFVYATSITEAMGNGFTPLKQEEQKPKRSLKRKIK